MQQQVNDRHLDIRTEDSLNNLSVGKLGIPSFEMVRIIYLSEVSAGVNHWRTGF